MPNLSDLGLRQTAITDAGMVHVSRIPNLERLDVNLTSFSDAGLAELRGKGLTFLRLNFTQVTNAGMQHVATMHDLRRLDLWATKVTDPGFDELMGLETLEHLELGSTAVSEQWIAAFKAAHPDCYVHSRYGDD